MCVGRGGEEGMERSKLTSRLSLYFIVYLVSSVFPKVTMHVSETGKMIITIMDIITRSIETVDDYGVYNIRINCALKVMSQTPIILCPIPNVTHNVPF